MQPGDRAGGAGDRDGGDGVPDVRRVQDHGAVVDGELYLPDEGRGGGAGADGASRRAQDVCERDGELGNCLDMERERERVSGREIFPTNIVAGEEFPGDSVNFVMFVDIFCNVCMLCYFVMFVGFFCNVCTLCYFCAPCL
ncbi:unnamed protein product [Linum tenue]|uniref:Uncharacterized protein n=1 Tax=Linum tenue TaxID=586396 RepID=A0AAV0QST4_9ROSI|nr:unnamed protein product [Linum tenue]